MALNSAGENLGTRGLGVGEDNVIGDQKKLSEIKNIILRSWLRGSYRQLNMNNYYTKMNIRWLKMIGQELKITAFEDYNPGRKHPS